MMILSDCVAESVGYGRKLSNVQVLKQDRRESRFKDTFKLTVRLMTELKIVKSV